MFIFSLLTSGAEGDFRRLRRIMKERKSSYSPFPRWITNTCFGSTVLRVSKVRLFKDLIGLLAHGQKEGRQTKKKNWRKNVSTKMFRVYMGFKVWEYHLSTNAVRRQYYPVWKVKIYSGTDNFQTTSRQFVIHI